MSEEEFETTLAFPKARKDHKCTSCKKKIPKGVRYWRETTAGEHPTVLSKEHDNCLNYHEEFEDKK